jgi:hypothetical protein
LELNVEPSTVAGIEDEILTVKSSDTGGVQRGLIPPAVVLKVGPESVNIKSSIIVALKEKL